MEAIFESKLPDKYHPEEAYISESYMKYCTSHLDRPNTSFNELFQAPSSAEYTVYLKMNTVEKASESI